MTKRAQRGLEKVARLMGEDKLSEAAQQLMDTITGSAIFRRDYGDVQARLRAAGITSSYVFAAHEFLERTKDEKVPWYRSKSAADNRRMKITMAAGYAATYGVNLLKEAYGKPPDGVFGRLERGEVIARGELEPDEAADAIIVSLYASAMGDRMAAPVLHQLLCLQAEHPSVQALQDNVRLMLPDADASYAAAVAEREAAERGEHAESREEPATVKDVLIGIVGEVVGGMFG